MPEHRASKPVKVNVSGSAMEGAFAPKREPVATVRAGDVLTAADMGKETCIGLLFGCCGEAPLFQLRI